MSHLSFLEKLLDGAEVAWLPLGDESVGEFVRGGNFQKRDFTEAGVGCIHYGQIYTHYRTFAYETKSFVSEEFAKKARKAKAGNLVIATTSENDEDVCKAVAWLGSDDIVVSNHTCIYKHNLNPKYVSYFFQTESFQSQKRPYITGIKVRSINANNLAKIVIPIPCPKNAKKSLAIQAEIVRILDKFTSLAAELTTELMTELNMRKKQYRYYRDQLLAIDEGDVKWKPLGNESVGEFVRGGNLQKKDFTKTGIGCIHYGQLYTHYDTFAYETKSFVSEAFAKKARKAKTGDLVIATTSENDEDVCKAVAWLGSDDIAVSSDACIYKHNLNPKYVSYFFQTESFQSQKRPYITGTKVRRVNSNNLAKIVIPIPCPKNSKKSLAIQAKIVRILDEFTALTVELTSELTAELNLRKKQYKYYRDLLLNFPKPEKIAK